MNWTLSALILVPIAISVGQILFKITSRSVGSLSVASLLGLLFNPWFLSALLIYGSATVAWIYVLRFVPVGRAYQFMALSFVAVPLGAWAVLGETLAARQLLGIAVIIAGLALINS